MELCHETGSIRDVIALHGNSLGARRAFIDGREIETNTTMASVRRDFRHSSHQIVTEFVQEGDSNFSVKGPLLPKVGFDTFRTDAHWHFLNASRVLPARATTEHQLTCIVNRAYFRDQARKWTESPDGWDRVAPRCPAQVTRQHLFYTALLEQYLPSGVSVDVTEIGGGFGGLAHVWLSTVPTRVRRYTIIDLEAALELQRWYLGKNLGQAELDRRMTFRTPSQGAADRSSAVPMVAVATYSITELDPGDVLSYLDGVVTHADFFLLAMARPFGAMEIDNDWVHEAVVDRGLYPLATFPIRLGKRLVTLFCRTNRSTSHVFR